MTATFSIPISGIIQKRTSADGARDRRRGHRVFLRELVSRKHSRDPGCRSCLFVESGVFWRMEELDSLGEESTVGALRHTNAASPQDRRPFMVAGFDLYRPLFVGLVGAAEWPSQRGWQP